MVLRAGQNLKCKASFVSDPDKYVGTIFPVLYADAKSFSVGIINNLGHMLELPFDYREYELYFTLDNIAGTISSKSRKCTCGFIPGQSVNHYSWCEMEHLVGA